MTMETPPAAAYFQRHEQKYLLNRFRYREFMKVLDEFAVDDEYELETIYSVYFDNPHFGITGNLLRKSPYKEKLRLRSYGIPRPGDTVYLELKKKYKGVSYKKRVPLPFTTIQDCFDFQPGTDKRVADEIRWMLGYYEPSPRLLISYDRRALRCPENETLRITLDTNIRWRSTDIDFSKGPYGKPLLNEDEYIMELKVDGAIPLFLTSHLTRLNIFPVSFSKYRSAYEGLVFNRENRSA
jgi:SPX domain protein involved in polyphosphate accumulation